MVIIKPIKGQKGGGGGKPYTPIEDENSLRSNSVARIIDIISEGEIEGLVAGDSSVFINDIPLLNNFEGISYEVQTGSASDTHIPGYTDEAPNITSVNTQLTVVGGTLQRTITNVNVDDCCVTIRIPRLLEQQDNGDITETEAKFKIEINTTEIKIVNIQGKCTAPYLRTVRITDLSQYGAAPWVIKLTRITADSSSAKLANDTWWDSYEEIINEKILYENTALVAFRADARQFGDRMPKRAYEIKGIKAQYPNNYDPILRTYIGNWDGSTFTRGYTNNPVWVYYDLLTSDIYGCDLSLSDIDIWTFYTISQYCDGDVDDGGGGLEPRFTFNGIINTREDAQKLLFHIAGNFRAKPGWVNGTATLIQDRPKDPVKIVNNSDVIDGLFQYTGTALQERYTSINVTWNDPNDLYRPAVEIIEDADGINLYGWNSIDVVAYGCTTRSQAIRYGRYILYTELQEHERITYEASYDHSQLIPGDIVIINDEHYITKDLQGRIKSATTTSVVIDRDVTLESGKTYTIVFHTPKRTDDADPTTAIKRVTVLNSPETTDTLTFAVINANEVPDSWAIFSLNHSTLDEKHFRIISIKPKQDKPNILEIVGTLHDVDKFTNIDAEITYDSHHYTDVNTGALSPPTALDAEEYTYEDGQNNLFGVMLSWTHPDDTRVVDYEIQSKEIDTAWYNEEVTQQNSYVIKNVTAGDYQYRVRSRSLTSVSVWVTTSSFTVSADPDALSAITNLQVLGGGTTFTGKNCEIEWGYTVEARFKEFVIKVYHNTTLLREVVTQNRLFIYTYDMNMENNTTPIRSINFEVYTRDVYDKLSSSANLTASNPIPTMAGTTPTLINLFKGLKIDWSSITPSDNDLEKYKVFLDTNNPPTTEIVEVGYATTSWIEVELDSETTYYCQIEPFDYFGAGTKSSAGNGEPLVLPGDGIATELTSTIEMTDTDSNTAETLSKLYDGNKISDGIAYILSGTDKYIEFKFPVEYIMDNVTAWFANANANIYIGYKRGEGSWNYLKAEADHTTDANGRLLEATNQADAQTNYLDTATGINRALFPQALVATHCRLYFIGTYTATIYELRFIREVIAEQIIADNLSSISANIGAISAGTIQSDNYDNTHGILLDLNGDAFKCGGSTDPKLKWDGTTLTIKAVTTFESASTGYDNINDKPSDLGDINSTEGTKLTGIATGADVTDYADDRVSNNKTENNVTTISRPGGGTYSGGVGATGAIKITLPQSWSNTMMKFVVDVFVFDANELFTLNIGGYNYDAGTAWINTSANLVGNIEGNNRVRFGHDGTNCCILIGNITTVWEYPKISVRDFQGAYTNYSIDQWDDGWAISLETDISGITFTSDYSDALIDAAAILNQGDLAIQDRTDLSYTDGADVTGNNTANNASNYTGAAIGTTYTAAKCTDANADQTIANTAANVTGQGDLATQDRTNLDYTDGADVTDYADDRVSNNKTENSVTTISRPGGGTYSGGVGATGAIKITLPQSWSRTMMKFVVDVFHYSTNKSFSLNLGGYNYDTSTAWINTSANLVGNIEGNNRVRFGHDGTKCCIVIGETTTVWNYPKISVRDFQGGNTNFTIDQWDDGWAISLETDISGITFTSDYSDALIDAAAILNQGDLAIQDRTDLNYTDGADVTGDNTADNTDNVGTLPAANIQGWAHSSDVTKIDGGTIYTGTIIAGSIAANAVTADKILANAVTADKILANAVTATKILADAVTATKINVTNLAAISADLGTITAGNITVNSSGFIKSTGKDSYTDTTPGFFIGYDSSAYKFIIGGATQRLGWDGSTLTLNGAMDGQVLGDNILYSNIENVYDPPTGGSWVSTHLGFSCGRTGNYRVKFSLRSSTGSNAYGRLYKNGVAIGIERNTSSTSWHTYSEDFNNLVTGDIFIVYIKADPSEVKNIIVYCDNPIQTGGAGY